MISNFSTLLFKMNKFSWEQHDNDHKKKYLHWIVPCVKKEN
jgi:hypothetical protein